MSTTRIAALAAGALLAPALAAQTATVTDLASCRAIEAAADRLACYDRLADGLASPAVPPQAPPPPEFVVETRTAPAPPQEVAAAAQDSAPEVPEAPAATSQPVVAEAPEAAPAPLPPERFGMEQVERKIDGPKVLESRLVDGYEGWFGDTRFELENGQVWEQVQQGRFRYRGPENPRVWIRRKAFGTYRLQVEGSNRTIKVERVR